MTEVVFGGAKLISLKLDPCLFSSSPVTFAEQLGIVFQVTTANLRREAEAHADISSLPTLPVIAVAQSPLPPAPLP